MLVSPMLLNLSLGMSFTVPANNRAINGQNISSESNLRQAQLSSLYPIKSSAYAAMIRKVP